MRDQLSEIILVLLVCLAPWAYGSVEAWAELGLYVGVALLTLLNYRRPSGSNPRGGLVRLPGLALMGLVLLALFQATPLGHGVLSWIAPSLAASRAKLVPDQPEHVLGDTDVAVALPPATLSLEPDSTLQIAARLSAAWLLFQAVLGLKGAPAPHCDSCSVVIFNAMLLSLFAIVQDSPGRAHLLGASDSSVYGFLVGGGPFLSHNHLAAYLNMGLGLALGCFCKETGGSSPSRFDELWTAYAAAIIAVGVISSQSRSGFWVCWW